MFVLTDIDLLSATGARRLDAVEVERVQCAPTLNSLTVGIDEADVYWGSEASAVIDFASETALLGRLMAIPASELHTAMASLEANGAEALGAYLARARGRARLFAVVVVDLAPGDPFPDGLLRMNIDVTFRVVGS